MNFGIIILSRMSSKRLPKKALIKINKIPIIDYVIKVAKNVINKEKIILSTSLLSEDDVFEKIAQRNDIKLFRGDLKNVYERFYQTMKKFNLEYAIRLNGDSPLNHHLILKKAIKVFSKNIKADIITNIFPRTFPKGMSTEIISRKLLQNNKNKISDKYDLENITSFFYKNEKKFNIINFVSNKKKRPQYNLSIDNKYDSDILKKILNEFPNFYDNPPNYKKIIEAYERKKR